jgi:hypothetical protein
MKTGMTKVFFVVMAALAMIGFHNRVLAADRIEQLESRVAELEENRWGERIAIHGVLAGVYQNEDPSGPADAESIGRGAVAFEPEIAITLTERDEVFFKFGFPAGNGLNGTTNMVVSPWAANLEGDVKNINGRDRDYLLTAWYKHTFAIDTDHNFGLTGGIIDATDYLDQNAYANDEHTQFMNPALVNGPNGFAPSYDIGGAVEWAMGSFYANGVVMNVGENDAGYNYNFYGAEVGYRLTTGLGQGVCRIIYEGGNNAFLNPDSTTLEDRTIVFLSVDQQLGEFLGVWVRLGWGDDDAAVDATNLYSGGIDIGGRPWGREEDNMGIGYAFFDGGNTGLQRVQVAEAYYRLVMNAWLALTGDVQYQDNQYDAGDGTDIDAWTWGLRAVVEF